MPYASFGDLRQSAVAAFVRTAILIDNEPAGESAPAEEAPQPRVANSSAFGARRPAAAAPPEPASADRSPNCSELAEPPGDEGEATVTPRTFGARAAHQLSVRPVTNAFAAKKITCGFYFPSDEDEDLVEVALAAARHVDATIVDWQLRANDSGPAKDLITRLVQEDRAAGGRLRLIVVYTGERGLDRECANLKEHLAGEGLNDFTVEDSERALRAPHTFIVFANKPARAGSELEFESPSVRPVAWADLPSFVLTQYVELSKGLLQAFALRSIGAIREDTHHLLSMFPPELDGAFLAQRAGIGTPGDAEEMMTAILVSEFATSIADRGVEADVLGAESAAHALQVREQPEQVKVKKYSEHALYKDIIKTPEGAAKHLLADRTSLEALLKVGLNSSVVEFKDRELLDLQFFPTDEMARANLAKFARLTTFSREVETARRVGRQPLDLTGGVIVRSSSEAEDGSPRAEYLLCVQPGCDAVRLDGVTAFPFCPLDEKTSGFDLILSADGVERTFRVNQRPRSMKLICFAAEPASRTVRAEQRATLLGFEAADGVFWEYVAQLRPLEAQHFTTLLVGKFNRVPLNGSEWLRLHRGGGND